MKTEKKRIKVSYQIDNYRRLAKKLEQAQKLIMEINEIKLTIKSTIR